MNDRRRETDLYAALLAGDILATVIVIVLADLPGSSWQAQAGWVVLTLFLGLWAMTLLTLVLIPVVGVVRDRYRRFVNWG